MRNLSDRRRETLPRWLDLVAATQRGLPQLVDAFIVEVKSIPTYSGQFLDEEHLRATAFESIGLLLETVARQTNTAAISDFTVTLGRDRARAGVPVEDLVAAVRLDFQIIWSGLLWRATNADMMVLALHVGELWAVVDEYARNVQQSYMDERAAMAASARDEQQIYLSELFEPGGTLPTRVLRIARALGVDPDADFRVAVLPNERVHDVYPVARAVATAGAAMFVVRRNDGVTVLWPASTRLANLSDELQARSLNGIGGGFVPSARGLAAVPAAVVAATEILATLRDNEDSLLTAEHAWARISKTRLDLGQGFSARILAAVEELTDAERTSLLSTVRAYLDTGNVGETAKLEFCHRNTVLNRLARFRALTGLDVTIPREAALAVLVLA